jgi:DNA modification methylase
MCFSRNLIMTEQPQTTDKSFVNALIEANEDIAVEIIQKCAISDFLYLNLSDVIIPPDRMRKEFTDTLELQEELKTSPGLIHPIFLNADNTLICGENRLRAMSSILEFGGRFYCQKTLVPEGKIPVQRALHQLSLLEVAKAEFGENNFRTPFTWAEKQAAKMRILALQMEKAGGEKPAPVSEVSLEKPARPNPFVGLKTTPRIAESVIAKTAEDFFGSDDSNAKHKIRQAIKIDSALKSIPELAAISNKFKSDKEALDAIAKHERAEAGKKKAQEVGKTFSGENHQIYLGDCIEVMGKFALGIYDVALFDPPFGMGANNFTKGGDNHSYDDSPENFKEQTPRMIRAVSRVLKSAAHLYIFCDFDKFHQIKAWVQDASTPGNPWIIQRVPIIMPKTGGGIPPQPGHSFRRTHEYILFAWRGGKQNTGTINDVLQSVSVEVESDHGAAKQPAALKQLLAHSCKAGDSVIDCTAGEGSTMVAGHELLLDVTLIEIDERCYGKCLEKLERLDG